jgi:hypothetical protein
LIDWYAAFSRFRLVQEDAAEVFHYYGFHLSSFLLRENNNVVVFPFPFDIFIPLMHLRGVNNTVSISRRKDLNVD